MEIFNYINTILHINSSFKFYAKVGGVSVEELQILEFSFYAGIDYDLSIKVKIFLFFFM